MPRTFASADIGSNTVHLLVAETDGVKVRRLANRSEWLGLGESVALSGAISDEQAAQLVAILREYRQIAAANRAVEFFVFATEAVRAAENHLDVLERIRRDAKLGVEVITPAVEAEWSLSGSRLDTDLGPNLTFFEVGGGSVQVARVEGGRIEDELSLPLGTGRLVAETGIRSPAPPDAIEVARRYIRERLAPWKLAPPEVARPVLASGGVVRGLWRAVHPDGAQDLAIEEIRYLRWASGRLSVPAIASRFACKLKRAATLLPGALVYEELMSHCGATEMAVSEYGVREGAILAMHAGSVVSCPT